MNVQRYGNLECLLMIIILLIKVIFLVPGYIVYGHSCTYHFNNAELMT